MVEGTTPAERADALAAAVAGDEPLAGWLAIYDALGIPVLDRAGVGLGSTADDPAGPSFDAVWMVSDTATRPGGLPVLDLVRVFEDEGRPSPELADALLADLRAAVTSDDPRVALFGQFVRQRALASGARVDLLDAAVGPGDVYVDDATALLVSWVVLRGMAAVAADGSTSVLGPHSLRSRAPTPRAATDTPCSESWGSEDTTYWVNWVSGKLASGVQLPGMESATKSLLEKLAELNPHLISGEAAQRIGKVSKVANLIGGLAALILSVASIDVSPQQEPTPLPRNKKVVEGDGKTSLITWTVFMDIGNLPDGNQKTLCAATFVLNLLGVGFSFPANGALPGVDVTFTGRKGFAGGFAEGDAFVYQNADEMKVTTDRAGEAKTTIIGKRQSHDYPDSAKERMREFSIDVSAQVEPENLNSLANLFFDSLSFGVAPDAFGIAAVATDIAKTLHWNLGEFTFLLRDWQAGWKIEQDAFGYHFSGLVCDLTKEFKISGTSQLAGAGGSGTFTVVPVDEAGNATWSFEGSIGGVFAYRGEGSASIDSGNAESPSVVLGAGEWVADSPGGAAPLGEHLPEVGLELVPLETGDCSGS